MVLKSRWESKNPENTDDVAVAAQELEPGPADQGGLSVFRAADETEGRRVAILHTMTSRGPEKVDFLLVPEVCFRDPRLELRADPNDDQHPYLSERHYLVLGLSNVQVRIDVTRAILRDTGHRLARISKSEIKEEAIQVLRDDPSIRSYVKERRWDDVLRDGGD